LPPAHPASFLRKTGWNSRTAKSITYDYLVIATGPDLAFDEIPGLGPQGFTQSICQVEHAEHAAAAFEKFCKNPGPIVVGAVQGASCFGPPTNSR
jgi:sulfide:quinone oxidoreductase